MVVQVQADLLAEAASVSGREAPVGRNERAADEQVAAPARRAGTGRYLLGSVVLVEAAWVASLLWLAVRVFA